MNLTGTTVLGMIADTLYWAEDIYSDKLNKTIKFINKNKPQYLQLLDLLQRLDLKYLIKYEKTENGILIDWIKEEQDKYHNSIKNPIQLLHSWELVRSNLTLNLISDYSIEGTKYFNKNLEDIAICEDPTVISTLMKFNDYKTYIIYPLNEFEIRFYIQGKYCLFDNTEYRRFLKKYPPSLNLYYMDKK